MLPFWRYLRLLPRSSSPIDDRKLHAAASFDSGADVVCCLALSRPLLPSLVGRGAVFVISVAQLDRPLRCASRAREAIGYLKDSLRFHTASYTFVLQLQSLSQLHNNLTTTTTTSLYNTHQSSQWLPSRLATSSPRTSSSSKHHASTHE